MQIYEVGGAVRDELLHQFGYSTQTNDRDWVVVGATPEEMIAKGFKPVGGDFPVFLHPKTHEEYALARTERKVAKGYHGFTFHASPTVTLTEDLLRRDLTINAMAKSSSGELIDPYGGLDDLTHRVLRHVSPAFSEDPVRILRLARFAARFSDFSVDPKTKDLVRSMVQNGEADALVAERVWAEIARGLMEKKPSKMFLLLIECGYWDRAFSTVRLDAKTLDALDLAAEKNLTLPERGALLFNLVTDSTALRAIKAPTDVIELTTLLIKNRTLALKENMDSLFALLDGSDILRRPERFEAFLRVLSLLETVNVNKIKLLATAYRSVNAAEIAKNAAPGTIAEKLTQARKKALALVF